MDNPKVTVMAPCRNESEFILPFLDTVAEQDYPQELIEVIVADGMSDDGTREKLQSYSKLPNLTLLDNPNKTVPFALNLCIEKAKGEMIIRLDVHSRYPKNYISRLIEIFAEENPDNAGALWETLPANESTEAGAIAIAMSHPLGVGNATYRTGATKIMEVDTVPFGCFRRSLFDRLGLFDTELTRNQDDEFNARIIQSGGKILLIPDLTIQYFARPKLKFLYKTFYQYGLFKPLVNSKLKRPATLRQFVPPLFVLFLFSALVFVPLGGVLADLSIATFTLYCLILFLVALITGFKQKRLGLTPWLIASFFMMHFSYGLGYLKGIWQFILFRKTASPDNTELSR